MKYKVISFILITLFIYGLLTNIYINSHHNFSSIKDKIIRLHVVANSDSPEDQALKLQIRNAVIEEIAPRLKNLADTEKVKTIITNNLHSIKKVAEKEMESLGKSLPIDVELGEYEFPTKVYGSLSFPAGSYQALNVKIGAAEGKNWWCVMFPPLCFIDIAQGPVSEKSIDELKEILTQEEIEMLQSHREKEAPVKMKFKIAEVLKGFNMKVAKIIGKKSDM